MRKLLLAGASVIALCGAPSAVSAQSTATTNVEASPSEEPPPSDAPPAASGLEDIVVTAQRRSESSQRAAIAIDVVGGSDLIESGITNGAELGKLVPALTIQQIGGGSTSFIRGVGNFSTFQTNDPAVAFNFDGVYIGRPQATGNTFFDLERIEVLKGPQGTLYGRNATAGVINVIPARPRPNALSSYANASYGNYDSITAEGAINLPVSATSAFRVSGAITNRDGYLSDGSADSKTEAVRAQFLAELTPDLTVRVLADYTHLGGTGTGLTLLARQNLNVVTGVFTVTPTGLSLSQGTGSPASQAFYTSLPTGGLTAPAAIPAGLRGRNRDPFPDLFRNNEFYGAQAEITYDAGFGTLTIIPAVRGDRLRSLSATAALPLNNNQRDRQYSVEARLAGSIGPVDYTVGAFYFHEDIRVRSGTLSFGTSLSVQSPQEVTTESYAPFARLVFNASDQLRLVGGLRYTRDEKDFDATIQRVVVSCAAGATCANAILPTTVFRISDLPFAVPAAGTSAPGPTAGSIVTRDADLVLSENRSDGQVTWRAGIEYDVAPRSLLYASVETGFRSGGFNISEGFETYDPEYITAYTVGSKNRFFDNRLQLNVEAFHWRYRDQQVARPGVDIRFRPGSITENLGRSTISGVEVDTSFLVTPSTIVSAQVAYLDSENKDFTYTVPSPNRPRTNCAVSPSTTRTGFFDINCAGLPGFNAPKWTINLGAEQTIAVGSEYELVLAADTQYRTRRYVGFEYQPEQLQGSSWTSNAKLTFGPSDGHWSVGGFVRNIENDRLKAAVLVFGGLVAAYSTAPRTYGIQGSVKF